MELLWSVIGAVAALVSVAVVIRGRQLTRARLMLHIGVAGLNAQRRTEVMRRRKRTILYGITPPPRDAIVVPIGLGVENLSSVPVSAVHLQLQFPAECLPDGARVVWEDGRVTKIHELKAPGRRAGRYGDIAQVVYDLDILRSKQPILVHEVVRVPQNYFQVDKTRRRGLPREIGTTREARAAFKIELSVWAGNTEPLHELVLVVICDAETQTELTCIAEKILGSVPRQWAAALLARLFHFRRSRQPELAELVLLRHDALNDDGDVNPTILHESKVAVLRVPNVRFTDSSTA